MRVTATKLRENVYDLLDRVIESGEVLEIERKGHILRIVPESTRSKLSRVIERPGVILGDPETFDQVDWSAEWRSDL